MLINISFCVIGILATDPTFAAGPPSSVKPNEVPTDQTRRAEGSDAEQPHQLPDDRLGIRTVPLLLLSRRDVQTDLKMTPEQIKAAEFEIEKLYIEAAGLKGKTAAEVVARRRLIDEAQLRWIEANLGEKQRDRLQQIDLWWEGTSALISRRLVTDALELTEQQREILKRAIKERDQTRNRGFNLAAEQRLRRTGLAVLSPDQKERWHAMLGRPFEPDFVKQASR